MTLTPEINTAAITLVGHFNPLIFRPEWFSNKNILTKAETDEAEVTIIHPEVVSFGINPWLKIAVEKQKFSAMVMQEPLVRLYDLVIGCFGKLPETPVSMLGINRDMHFNLETEEKWHSFGDKLAPKQPWGNLMINEKNERLGGLVSLSMKIDKKYNELPNTINIKTSPSSNIKYGVHVRVNDHYELAKDRELADARAAVDLIKKQWQDSMANAEKIAKDLMTS